MYFDSFTISALVDEFMDVFVGGRIQDVLDVDRTGLGIEIYANHKRHYLYISADTQTPRIHLVGDKLRRGLERPTQLGLMFRSFVEDGKILHINQPLWERVIHIYVEGPEGEVIIIVETMERRSNILLVRDGIILDCMRRVGPEDNRMRLSLPNHQYMPPPPITGKRSPFNLSIEDITGFFQQNTDPKQKTAQILSAHLLGVSPLLSKEIVFRAEGDTKQKAADTNLDKLLDTLSEVVAPLEKRDWQPGIVETESGIIEAYSVYPVTHLSGWKHVETISEAVTTYYGAAVGTNAYNEAKKPVMEGIHEARARLNAKLASLERSITDESERELLKQSGELILAYQYTLQPKQTEFRAQYDPEGPELVVKLDSTMTPLENAQRYFERYDKAKRALSGVPELIADARNELAYIEQLAMDIENAANWPEIDDVQQALLSRGYLQGKVKRIGGGGRTGPLKLTSKDGYVIWVGRNSRQNELATFKNANPQDFWLHARDVPGAHVIIRNDGRRISNDLIERAAAIAAYYSTRRSDNNVIVDVTRRKHVKKIKGAGPGMVTYRNEYTITVKPQNEKILE